MFKKLLAPIVALSMLMALLSACGGNPVQETVTDSPVPMGQIVEPTRGIVENNVVGEVFSSFESEYLGLRFTLTPSWVPFTDQGSLDSWAYSMGILTPFGTPEYGDDVMLDILAFTRATNSSVAILYKRHDSNYQPSVSQVIDEAAAEIEAAGGYYVDTTGTVKIGSNDWNFFSAQINRDGVTTYQRHFINIQGGFVRIIMITYDDAAESVDDILAMFSDMSEPEKTPPIHHPSELVGEWLIDGGGYSIVFNSGGHGERRISGQDTEPFEWGAVGNYDLFTDYEWIIYRHWYTLEGDVLTIVNPMNTSYTEVFSRM